MSQRNFTLLTVVDKLLWNQLVNISVFHLHDDKILLVFVNELVQLNSAVSPQVCWVCNACKCTSLQLHFYMRILSVFFNLLLWNCFQKHNLYLSVADPDLQIRGGPGHPDPEIREGGGTISKKIFPALLASVWSKNKGLGPSLGSAAACLHYFPYAVSAKFVCVYKLIRSWVDIMNDETHVEMYG